MAQRHALLAGASGLVGGHVLQRLLAHAAYERVTVLVRRPLPLTHAKLTQLTVDFSTLPELPKADDAFGCLGTTIKKAGSQDAFRKVDHDAVVNFAAAALKAGAQQFLHVTGLGASRSSRVFYNRVKGETEADISALGYPSLHHFRPSMLDGERQEQRSGERMGLAVMNVLSPVLGKYRPIHGDTVAAAMIAAALQDKRGVFVHESDEIHRMAV